MKTLKISMILWLFISLMSCSDDEKVVITTGNIDVSFNDDIEEVIVYIYDLEKYEGQEYAYPLYKLSMPNGKKSKVSVQVNAGNYVMDTNGYHERLSFQVIPGKTTSVVYNSEKKGTVSRN